MSFDNMTMHTKVPSKPHIAFIDGWWRVSSIKLKRRRYGRAPWNSHPVLQERWDKAHAQVRAWNEDVRARVYPQR